jgi:hypothetical protein
MIDDAQKQPGYGSEELDRFTFSRKEETSSHGHRLPNITMIWNISYE